jgi:hypothetical protein
MANFKRKNEFGLVGSPNLGHDMHNLNLKY